MSDPTIATIPTSKITIKLNAAPVGRCRSRSHNISGVASMARNMATSSGTMMVLAALRPAMTTTSDARVSKMRIPLVEWRGVFKTVLPNFGVTCVPFRKALSVGYDTGVQCAATHAVLHQYRYVVASKQCDVPECCRETTPIAPSPLDPNRRVQ